MRTQEEIHADTLKFLEDVLVVPEICRPVADKLFATKTNIEMAHVMIDDTMDAEDKASAREALSAKPENGILPDDPEFIEDKMILASLVFRNYFASELLELLQNNVDSGLFSFDYPYSFGLFRDIAVNMIEADSLPILKTLKVASYSGDLDELFLSMEPDWIGVGDDPTAVATREARINTISGFYSGVAENQEAVYSILARFVDRWSLLLKLIDVRDIFVDELNDEEE